MIEVIINRPSFEYDIHSLVQAFFPRKSVNVRVKEEFTEETAIRMSVFFTDESVAVELTEDGVQKGSGSRPIDWNDRKETKNQFKRLIYEILSAYTGRTLPWGTLTGIRPTKLAMQMLEQGRSNVEIAAHMRDTWLVSREKASLSVMIANRERYILRNIDYEDGYSLYVGVPFCPSICLYCSFSSYPLSKWKEQVDAYLDALFKELDYLSGRFRHKKLNTVYIGGGTPTTLEPRQLDRLLTKIQSSFDMEHLQEFTVEAGRPDSITREKLQVLLDHGISRISINPQTMNDRTLEIIGRRHTVAQIREAYGLAREMGFSDINMDLIVGLPGETYEDVEHTMDEIAALAPDSVTVHSLAVKRAARLKLFRDQYEEMGMENSARIMDMTALRCAEMGLSPYYLYRQKNMAGNFENVGYAKVDKAGIYNILIMEEKQTILAAGAGAATKVVMPPTERYPDENHIERVENVKDVGQYIARIDEMIGRKEAFFTKSYQNL
ncbi:MAG: coproporphyrinogen dehydrogenase HemZ [Lachnospiraceae bacterium]|nr:coproporphyrinogen dehydrogenase HemZ [Lachnospiraceae bacterium]